MKKITKRFTDALLQKCRGDMSEAAAFMQQFESIADAEGITPDFRDVLRRGMFLILKARLS
jgi:hypothetical protein